MPSFTRGSAGWHIARLLIDFARKNKPINGDMLLAATPCRKEKHIQTDMLLFFDHATP